MSFLAADERTRTDRIRQLNDNLRQNFAGGRIVLSASVADLGHELRAAALMEMRKFSDFSPHNDPYGEHDFGSFEIGHYTFVFKVDYMDEEMIGGSDDPSDPEKTTRVLTLCLREDY